VVTWLARVHGATFAAGQTPVLHLEFASWFTITGVLLVLIALLAVSAAATALGDKAKVPSRAAGLRVVFGAMSILWFVTLSVFSRA
jgi:predicted membrane channel-forming protein YqfA (hemolysin III family)